MANNQCSFSFVVECSNEESAEALVRRIDSAMISSRDTDGWLCLEILERDGNSVHIAESEGTDLEALANVLQGYLRKWNPTGHIGFAWAYYCSKLRPDEFGGGSVFITANRQDWLDSSEWLYKMIEAKKEKTTRNLD